MPKLTIRPSCKGDFATAIDWAAAEGWNPGIDDLAAFYAADPDGFLMGWIGDTPVASISVVKYGEDYGFLGFYIVAPAHRGNGYGMAIWNAGMEYLTGRTVGLDGVVDQQENYCKSGFVLAGRNIRYSGVPVFTARPKVPNRICKMQWADFEQILAYDQQFFPADRAAFLRAWLLNDGSTARQTLVAIDDGMSGYGSIRRCRSGYKIGPLFADNAEIAHDLLVGLCDGIPAGQEVSLDVPEINLPALELAKSCGLLPAFETARMYRGQVAPIAMHKTFGITSFELG